MCISHSTWKYHVKHQWSLKFSSRFIGVKFEKCQTHILHSFLLSWITWHFLYNSFWWATSEIERKSIEIYYDPRVAYFYQNVAIVGQFYEKKRLKYFVYVNRIDGKYNEKFRHVDHFFGMQSIKIFLFFWDFWVFIEIKME